MRELLLKRASDLEGDLIYTVETTDGETCYTLVKQEETLLMKRFVVESNAGGKIADMSWEHILFEKVKMPRVEVSCKDGVCFGVRREMEQLTYGVKVSGGEIHIKGDVYSDRFELLYQGNPIAVLKSNGGNILISAEEEKEALAVTAALAIEVVK